MQYDLIVLFRAAFAVSSGIIPKSVFSAEICFMNSCPQCYICRNLQNLNRVGKGGGGGGISGNKGRERGGGGGGLRV